MSGLVLSLFPGIGMLDHAFELEGFCVVRGPDLLWGGDIHRFHPPGGVFDGVIGGPPCQAFSPIGNVNRARYGDGSVMADLIPEFARVVSEASPSWYVMENSPHAYAPFGSARRIKLDNAWFGERQKRVRAFWREENSYVQGQKIETHIATATAELRAEVARVRDLSLERMCDYIHRKRLFHPNVARGHAEALLKAAMRPHAARREGGNNT